MCRDSIKLFLSASCLIAAIRSDSELPDDSSTVFPQVYEQRSDISSKVLVIGDDYSLDLVKASVLSDPVLLRVVTEFGVEQRYVDGPYHERNLYQDTSKQASLILKPLRDGHYHVVGLLNFTHRIEPLLNHERSSRSRAAHRISKVVSRNGPLDAATSLGAGEDEIEAPTPDVEERAPLQSFTIELFSMSDYKHATHFGSQTDEHVEYLTAFWHSVSLRMQQLNPPGFIALIAIEISSTGTEPYLDPRPDGKLVSNETLLKLQQYTWRNRSIRVADVVFLVTGRDIVDLVPGGVSTDAAGVAYLGKACGIKKVGIGEDDPGQFSGVNVAAHEIAHLLSSPHDGEGASSSCRASDGYIMNPSTAGRNIFHFSDCSKNAIATFLKSPQSYCLKDTNRNRHIVLLPDNSKKLPGELMSGEQYCKFYFPKHPQVTYIKKCKNTFCVEQ
ncbi:venom metalloproteinase antarease-like TtrivMP_A isoform X2 [Dermacentor variabilis]|uniref:venom metalloproteinase antarease-like TtrivMP_A isoform X2 n=1 Tax=Dermacentor variabilis TaxID=34621 RepID=UPI003F5BEBA9